MKKLFPILFLLLLFGCKPKQIIQERIITKVDSTAVLSLQQQINAQNTFIDLMKSEIQVTREENVKLQNEISKHEINYDTTATIDPETGKYPIASEVITESKTLLKKTIQEFELLKQEYQKEINNLMQVNSNLERTVKVLKDENKELKEKIIPTIGFNFRLFFTGIGIGILLSIVAYLFFKFK